MAWVKSALHFLQRLIQTPSLPGEEGEIAHLLVEELKALAFDEVHVDEAGNVIGVLQGQEGLPALMLATHLDHVDVGREENWPYPPYGGEIHDGRIWGRGAVDIKGPLAAQVYGLALLREQGKRPPGTVYLVATVQEEVGGLGAYHLVQHLKVPLVVVGEPSQNQLRIGQRGRTEMELHIQGRSVHASMPEKGVNPLDVLARFLLERTSFEPAENPFLGKTSLAPTLVRVDQTSTNVIPGELWQILDVRYVPEQSPQDVLSQLDLLVERSLIPGASASLRIPVYHRRTYTGLKMEMPADIPPFFTPPDHPLVRAAREVLGEIPVDVWRFATDGGHYAAAGMKVIGFGPGDEALAHTVQESLPLKAFEEAIDRYACLAMELVPAYERHRREG